MRKSVTKGFTVIIILIMSVFSAIIFLSFRQSSIAKNSAALVAHTHEVMFQTSDIVSIIKDNETGSRGFILTGKEEFIAPLESSKKNIYKEIDTLRFLTKDNIHQQSRIDSLLFYVNKKIAFSDNTIAIRKTKGLNAATDLISFGEGKTYMENISRLTNEMQQEENRLLKIREHDNDEAAAVFKKIIISIIVVIVLLVIILATKDYLLVTEKKVAEGTLKKNEIYLDLMANNIKDYAIFMLDENGLVLNWNRGAETVLGYEKWEITGKSFNFLFTQKDIDDDEPARNLGLAKKYGQYETEGTRVKKDKQTFWANLVFTGLLNDKSVFYGYSVIVRDITERKKAQEQLEFLSKQINHSNDAIFVIDENRKIKSWNKGAENLYGYTTWEVLDKDAYEVLKTAMTEEEINSALQIIRKENHWTGEIKRQTKDGREIFVHSSTSTIRDSRNNITGYVAVSFDITAQKELREKANHLASIVEQSTEAIISTGLDDCIISWNSGAEKLYGLSKMQTTGKTFTALQLAGIAGKDQSSVLHKLIARGSWKTEFSFMRNGALVFYGNLTASLVKNEQGEAKSVVYIINDISLRKQLEEKLQRNNEELEQRVQERTEEITKNELRFRALIENSAEGISLLDEASDVIYRSPSAYKIIGNSPTKNSISYAHPDDLIIFKNKFSEAIKSPHTPVPYNVRYKNTGDGTYFWTEGTFTNLLDVKGVNAIVANYRDVTQRKEAEEKLIANEKQFRNTLDSMIEGVQIIGFDWRYIYVNDAMAKHGRYPKESFIGTTVMEKYPGIEETSVYQIYKRCFEERVSFHLENEFIYPDKSVAWFELSFRPVPEGLFILSVDITDRKKAEAKLIESEQLYRRLFENILHGFSYCKTDIENGRLKDFTYLSVNNEYELMTGLKNVTGKKLSEINPALLETENDYINVITKVAQGGSPEKFESYVKALDLWFSISIYCPEHGYFVALIDNITEQKRTEHKIRKLNAELEARVTKRTEQLNKTNEELEAFSYSVSHDLRAPLRAIIGFTAILEEDYSSKLDAEAKRITNIIKSNTLKMGHLIDDLLMFSRMGRHDIVKTNIDTRELVNDIINQPEIKQHNANKPVTWQINNLPPMVGDINTIRQVWINLVSNAVKYSGKADAPVVEIGSFRQNGSNVFFVKDNGVGFDEKYKNKLFRVFQRLHSADEFEGTGIGLAIVEKIISKHDGKVWAESEPGKGAAFYFSLPVNAVTEQE